MITLDEMKNYLRVDYSDDDSLITNLIDDANNRVMDILRIDSNETVNTTEISNYNLSIMYCVAYLYEHREDADYNALNIGLRSLLFGNREVEF